ncbi:MAG TPA: HDIG domain-containing protein [Acidobacteriota bacterium]|nr:HDIG domain-containing protein [Acidobacteriota bacterium]
MPSREEAWQLLTEYTKNPSLIKHALAVEAGMRAYARKFGADEEKWGVVGLLHDFDYEQNPSLEDHPFVGCRILEEKGYPDDIVHAIKSHANHTGVPRQSKMDKSLFAVDELSGLITAVALVRPSKKIADVKIKSVKKKIKDKAFARSVSREDIRQGVDELGVDMNEHIAFLLEAMTGIAQDLELDGSLAQQ